MKYSEIFHTLQGEGKLVGVSSVFFRTSFCNLRCSWCDTRYAHEEGDDLSLESILERIASYNCSRVVLTGGEPLQQPDVHRLIAAIAGSGWTVILETSGAMSLDGLDPRTRVIMDIKCPSSGMADRMCWANMERLREQDEIKMVLADREDYEYAKSQIDRWDLISRCAVCLQPAFGCIEPRMLVEWILEDRLDVRCLIQQHKIIWPPDARGV